MSSLTCDGSDVTLSRVGIDVQVKILLFIFVHGRIFSNFSVYAILIRYLKIETSLSQFENNNNQL